MRELPAGKLARLLGATLIGDPALVVGPDVVIDSRKVTPGCLFVALRGERQDGHDFVESALAAGAAAALVGTRVPASGAQLVVDDPRDALAALARSLITNAAQGGMVSIGITGSSGKTTTKDLTEQVLATIGDTVAPFGSQNNEIGVPLTATRINDRTRFLVSELGARGAGHIAWLCQVVQPRVGAVLNVGHAHLGEFGSVSATAAAKSELVAALPADGWAVLNFGDEKVARMGGLSKARIAAFCVSGDPKQGELRVWAEEISPDSRQRHSFTLHAAGTVHGQARVSLQLAGEHQVANALAAGAIGLTQGIGVTEVARALSAAVPVSNWRMELLERADGLLILNDAYNANPDSMAAALHALAGMRRPGGRLMAILGDMLELGPAANQAHRSIGELAARLGVDALFAVGEHAQQVVDAAASLGLLGEAGDRDQAVAAALRWARPADVVLVKASRGLALEVVAQQLAAGLEGGRR